MLVFRITTAKWSHQLSASGYPARWNSKGIFILYTASSRSLACLENLVHRQGSGLIGNFKVMTIEIPESVSIENLEGKDLPADWKLFEKLSQSQRIGDEWYRGQKSCVIRVPSAIIPEEYNYLINTSHPDFSVIKIANTDSFLFDDRLG